MSELWKYIKNLFQSTADSSASNPAIHELIQRSESEIRDFEKWKKSLVCRRLLDWINNQYATYLIQTSDVDEAIDFLKTPSAKGFVIYFRKMHYSKREIQHFFDLLKEQVKKLGYRSYVSDTRTYTKGKWVENIQRHYLKPRSNFEKTQADPPQKMEQQYGNINIEICTRDEEVWNLKFSATSYNDRMYKKADNFGGLILELMKL